MFKNDTAGEGVLEHATNNKGARRFTIPVKEFLCHQVN